MKPIFYNKHIKIGRCNDNLSTRCSYCRITIGKKNLGLHINSPKNTYGDIWIHINCIDKFAETIMKLKEDNIKDIVLDSLTEKKKNG